MKKKIRTLLAASLLTFNGIPLSLFCYDQHFIQQVTFKHLQTLGSPPDTTKPPINLSEIWWDTIKKFYKPDSFKAPEFNQYELFELIYKTTGITPTHTDTVISLKTVNKMDLVAGSGENNNAHLASYLSTVFFDEKEQKNLIQTRSGTIALVKNISQPHTNTNLLIKRQQAIKLCVTNQPLINTLTTTLQAIAAGEKSLISYLKPEALISSLYITFLRSLILWPLRKFTHNALGEELNLQIGRLESIVSLMALHKSALMSLNPLVQDNLISQKDALLITILCFLPINTPVTITGLLTNNNLLNYLQTELIGAAAYINGAKKLYQILSKYPNATINFSQLETLKALVTPSKKYSAEFNELINLLATNTFKGKSSCFSLSGRILRAHTLLSNESVQRELAEIINAVGELDMYVALAHKINNSQGTNAPYSFVEYDTTSTVPYIKARGIWNPFVSDAKAVVGNTVELGGNKPRNIILSGPNTGGKSTLAKSVLLNLILAQVFGIAAAEQMIITLFNNLDCYVNMTDDTAGKLSGLKAEGVRAQEIVKKIKETSGFNFILLDEIFTATSPDQAERLAVKFIDRLSRFNNCLFINASHFDGIIKFAERSPHCRNCHMGALTDNQGKILKYTYLLQEGRSHIKNAEQVVEELFDDDFFE